LVLVDQSLLLDVRDYRNGFAVPALGWTGATPPANRSPFERFRLYARSIDAVEDVVAWLHATGVEPVSALDQIAPLRSLNASLSTILRIIGAFAALGFVVSLGATRWSSVQRKHRELALLTLVGYGRGWLVGLPLVQASLVAMLGTLLAGSFFGAAALLINATFPGVTNACALTAGQLAAAAGLTWCLAVLAATAAAITAARIDPAAAIRDS
jgi:putative ABC transport system permease protein